MAKTRLGAPNDRPTFFIDRSLGSSVIRSALKDAGAKVEVHDDHFTQDAEDIVWLTEVGKRSWVVLTKDRRIRKRILERRALKAAAVHAFFLGNGCRGGPAMANAYVPALPAMLRAMKRASGPIWMSVHADGRLTPLDQEDDRDESEDAIGESESLP